MVITLHFLGQKMRYEYVSTQIILLYPRFVVTLHPISRVLIKGCYRRLIFLRKADAENIPIEPTTG